MSEFFMSLPQWGGSKQAMHDLCKTLRHRKADMSVQECDAVTRLLLPNFYGRAGRTEALAAAEDMLRYGEKLPDVRCWRLRILPERAPITT